MKKISNTLYEYRGYKINKNSKGYYCKILTSKGMIIIKADNKEEFKEKLNEYLDRQLIYYLFFYENFKFLIA